MRVILGIGNPGKEYLKTRHNIGFEILDLFALKHKLEFIKESKDYIIAGSEFKASHFYLIKPQTYVNLSGIAAKQLFDKLPFLQISELLVVVDDLNLPCGKLRIRQSGGDGGHNGIKSLIYHLESDQFPRLRVGIGDRFGEGEMADYVLGKFHENELKYINKTSQFSVELIEEFISGGLKKMLNFYSKNKSFLDFESEKSE